MAYLISTSFFTPFRVSDSQFQGTHTKSLIAGMRINRTGRTGIIKNVSHKYSDGRMSSLNRSYHCSTYVTRRRCTEPTVIHLGECYSGNVRISGFWVGPDIEDGWGFVDASVHRII